MSCIVHGCFNTKRIERELSFFCLPKNRALSLEWLRIIGRLDIAHDDHKIYKICSEHFTQSDYTKLYPRKLLSHEAVPSIKLQHSQSDPVNIIGRSNEENLLSNPCPKPGKDVENTSATDSLKTYLRLPTNTLQSADKTTQVNLNESEMKRKKIDLLHRNNRANVDLSFLNIDERLKKTHKRDTDYYKRYCKAKKTISHLRSKLAVQKRSKDKFIVGNVNLEDLLAQCRSLLSDSVFSLFENELYVALNKGKHFYAYSKTMRHFCLQLYKESPKAYSILSNTLHLPQRSTVKYWLRYGTKRGLGNEDGQVKGRTEYEDMTEQCEKYYEEVQYLDEDMLKDEVSETEAENCHS